MRGQTFSLDVISVLMVSFLLLNCKGIGDTFQQINKAAKIHDSESLEPVWRLHKRDALNDFKENFGKKIKDKLSRRIPSLTSSDEDASKNGENEEHQMSPPPTITYIGCYSAWEKQFTRITIADEANPYDDGFTPNMCAEKCKRRGTVLEVVFLKGAECLCAPIYGFNSSMMEDKHCNLPCPIRNYDPSTSEPVNPSNSCGGNLGYSVYCAADEPGECMTLASKRKQVSAKTETTSMSTDDSTLPVLENLCSSCSGSVSCRKPYISPDFDYFPANTPKQCIEFCAEDVRYVGKGQPDPERIRSKTPYAVLSWWKMANVHLPICRCLSEDLRRIFMSASDPSKCKMPCPGMPSTNCGGKESDDKIVFATLYCVDKEICGNPTTTTLTTIDEDPCNIEGIDCDDVTVGTTEFISETTLVDETSRDYLTNITTTTIGTTKSEETTTLTTPVVLTSKSTSTTVKPNTTRTTTPNYFCFLRCEATDRQGFTWDTCAGNTQKVPCSALNNNSTGYAYWKCSDAGYFETLHPDVSNCSSPWLIEKAEELNDIKDVGEATDYIEKLAESSQSPKNTSSPSQYFGHEIRNITMLIDKVLHKARGFAPPFHKFESLVKKAIDLNAFLIQFRDPWRDLVAKERSSVCSYLIGNTENAILHLTQEVVTEAYSQVLTLQTTDIYKFLILAETFNKLIGKGVYEFPHSASREVDDAFIKLPEGWDNLLPDANKKVELAAMSIDSQYISYVMPGQFDNLVSSSALVGDDDTSKLINGRLISLTVSSSRDSAINTSTDVNVPTLNFKGKGVEITFHHDIEAWGAEKQDVPRRLHIGEKPKAVLGSTQCVFWDTQSNSWSSRGCHVLRSNRYETVCECEHLTSFAVLMDVHRYVGKELGLQLLTLILCPASEVALFVSIIILSSVSGLQKMRAAITKNLSLCLLVGNALVLFVLDRNYFDMSAGLCTGAAMVTHYVFLCSFMWMLIEGIQLYRMVVHVFDSGKSYITYFGVFAYGTPLIIVAITAGTGYLRGDRPYGGDVYCWLEDSYIWSFMGPVAVITLINLVILFIALKAAYQLRQNKKLSPAFVVGKIGSYRTWFKGCFSLTTILGLTWVVGFFTIMKAPSGTIAAYIFTVLNASQGLFIFFFNCVCNDKVRSFTRRNLSTYLPSWLTSSFSTSPAGNNASVYGKQPLSTKINSTDAAGESIRKRTSGKVNPHPDAYPTPPYIISQGKLNNLPIEVSIVSQAIPNSKEVSFPEQPFQRCESIGTISIDSMGISTTSENGVATDISQTTLISDETDNQ